LIFKKKKRNKEIKWDIKEVDIERPEPLTNVLVCYDMEGNYISATKIYSILG